MVDRIPILKMGRYLLLSIQVDMHDQLALDLQEDLTDQIVRHGAKGVLIDISSLEIVDSFIGRMLSHIADVSRILDAKVIVVGMQPAVAITLMPCARPNWTAAIPTPPLAPWTSRVSAGRALARMNSAR